MHKHLQIKICVILLVYFQPIAQTYKLYQVNADAENELIPKLKRILQKVENNGENDYSNNYITDSSQLSDRKEYGAVKKYPPLGKSRFVKRIVPHNYKSGTYEYDSKLNTVFKPLVRYHVKKPVEEHERDVMRGVELNNKLKDGFNDALIVLVKKDRNNHEDLLPKIQKLLYTNSGKRKIKKRKRFRSLLARLQDKDIMQLRTVMLEKSGEHRDPFAPGNNPHFIVQDKPPEEEPAVVKPQYPFYNYWTYQKQIIQDECKGNLIQLGDMCVSVVGHRKSNDNPPDGRRKKSKKSTKRTKKHKKSKKARGRKKSKKVKRSKKKSRKSKNRARKN